MELVLSAKTQMKRPLSLQYAHCALHSSKYQYKTPNLCAIDTQMGKKSNETPTKCTICTETNIPKYQIIYTWTKLK